MLTAEQFVEQVAGLAVSEKLGEQVAEGVKTLEGTDVFDPTLLKDDALTYFDYDGEDVRNKQIDFLIETRSLLEPRYAEIEALGHSISQMSIVSIDQTLKNLDLLLSINQIGKIRKLLIGKFKDLCAPDTILSDVDYLFGETIYSSGEISDSVLQRKFGGIDLLLGQFDTVRLELQEALEKIGHLRLQMHLKQWMLEPANKFNSSSVCQDARKAVASKVSKEFRSAWTNAKSLAEKRFEQATKKQGKKQSLASAIQFDDGFGPALDLLEKAVSKGSDVRALALNASKIGGEYAGMLEKLPEELKKMSPDFYEPLHSTLLGSSGRYRKWHRQHK